MRHFHLWIELQMDFPRAKMWRTERTVTLPSRVQSARFEAARRLPHPLALIHTLRRNPLLSAGFAQSARSGEGAPWRSQAADRCVIIRAQDGPGFCAGDDVRRRGVDRALGTAAVTGIPCRSMSGTSLRPMHRSMPTISRRSRSWRHDHCGPSAPERERNDRRLARDAATPTSRGA